MQGVSSFIRGEEGMIKIRVPWEDTIIEIPLNFAEPREAVIYRVIRTMKGEIGDLREQVQTLRNEQNQYIIYKFNKMSNKEAENEIVSYLKRIKSKVKEITIFELSQSLRLPADQVEEIMEGLSKTKKVNFL